MLDWHLFFAPERASQPRLSTTFSLALPVTESSFFLGNRSRSSKLELGVNATLITKMEVLSTPLLGSSCTMRPVAGGDGTTCANNTTLYSQGALLEMVPGTGARGTTDQYDPRPSHIRL